MFIAHGLLQSLIALVLVAVTSAASVSPLVIPPSLYWDGDDGQWSSFHVEVGTPPQTLRLLPGTSVEASTLFWIVRPEGCAAVNPTLANCANARGGIFKNNASTSWSTQGLSNSADGAIYTLVTVEESKIGLNGNGSYGYDTVSLGLGKTDLPSIPNSLIAEIWTNDFFIGSLPLSPLPFNFTGAFDKPITSMLGRLRNSSRIPSLSWGYTAGAYYQDSANNKFGSLVLGGYDASRFKPNNVSFSFGSDITRDLLLKLTSITYDTISAAPLLTSPINVFIDSLVSEMWLPVNVCESFARSFNLTYNTQSNRYLIDNRTHAALVAQNPTFSFALSNGTQTVTIALPYAAFNLNLTAPIVGDTTHHFPIRRGQNESQYVLGRAFLQEAYVIADYEQRKFQVAQALFPPTSVNQNIITIEASGVSSPTPVSSGSTGNSSGGLGAGAIAGIVVGVVVLLIVVAAIIFVLWRRRKNRTKPQELPSNGPAPTELDDNKTNYLEIGAPKTAFQEMDATKTEYREMEGSGTYYGKPEKAHEMANQQRHEMGSGDRIHELPTGRNEAVELDAS